VILTILIENKDTKIASYQRQISQAINLLEVSGSGLSGENVLFLAERFGTLSLAY
jgi:hypothetical protein